jgi:hypothetical protein
MTNNLVYRLRMRDCGSQTCRDERTEAADRIEELEAALRPFAKWADWHDDAKGTDVERCFSKAEITVGELRDARKALEGGK